MIFTKNHFSVAGGGGVPSEKFAKNHEKEEKIRGKLGKKEEKLRRQKLAWFFHVAPPDRDGEG